MQSSSFDDEHYLLNETPNKIPKFVYVLTLFSAIGGFLFGYDTGVISGAMLLLKDSFFLSSFWQESIVSATIGAAVIFSLIGGILNDIIGRKITIIIASLMFSLGSICLAAAYSKTTLLAGRTIVGCGIGLASMSVPIYIAEMSPPELRGRLVTLNNVFVTGGQFIASVIDGLFSYDRINGWRYMLGLAFVPAATQLTAFIFLPESPRWLISKGRDEKARKVLDQISPNHEAADQSYRDIKSAVTLNSDPQSLQSSAHGRTSDFPSTKAPQNLTTDGTNVVVDSHYQATSPPPHALGPGNVLWCVLRDQTTRRALTLGCFLQIIQQLCGINTVMYYSATIIEMSGVRDKSKAIWLSAATALVNFACTFVGLYLVERVGRRILTLYSLAGVIVSLGVLALGFQLAALTSPAVTYHPKEFINNPCDTYNYCYACVEDNTCGFCYREDPVDRNRAINGSCLPTTRTNSTRSFMGRCMNGIPSSIKQPRDENYYKVHASHYQKRNKFFRFFRKLFKRAVTTSSKLNVDDDDNLVWAYNFCPTKYYWLPILGLFLYLITFAPGMGPMPWTINSEIYPLWARSTCNSVAAACNWTTNLLVSMTFLTLTELIGKHATFWLYALFACLGFIVLLLWLPETKGKSLEQMESLFSPPEKSPLLSPHTPKNISNAVSPKPGSKPKSSPGSRPLYSYSFNRFHGFQSLGAPFRRAFEFVGKRISKLISTRPTNHKTVSFIDENIPKKAGHDTGPNKLPVESSSLFHDSLTSSNQRKSLSLSNPFGGHKGSIPTIPPTENIKYVHVKSGIKSKSLETTDSSD